MNIISINATGVGEKDYPKTLEGKASKALLAQYLDYVRNLTTPKTGQTKTRAEVSGGGIKPWRQKGTGRARQGSIRAPQWKGGGVTFGPRQIESRGAKMPKKMRQTAYLSLLTAVAKEKRLIVVEPEKLEIKDLRQKLNATRAKNRPIILVVADSKTSLLAKMANLAESQLIRLDRFGANQMIGKATVALDQASLDELEKRYQKTETKK